MDREGGSRPSSISGEGGPTEVDDDQRLPSPEIRQAMQGEMAQPFESQDQEDLMDQGGGMDTVPDAS